MIHFITNYLGTIIIALVLLAVVCAVLYSMRRKRKAGKNPTCGCGCSGCPSAEICHKN
ncbi:MAG: FeoB-associated Cys-rich membrane protein [Ruminococcus sp.]|nr:FeoB-associated Cys-rich membrane protein [Ruminococcus sp.]